jgi:hypothetical protein
MGGSCAGRGVWLLCVGLLALLVTGCPTTRSRGGSSSTVAGTGGQAHLAQSEDPSTASRQASEHVVERTFTLAKGSTIRRTGTSGSQGRQTNSYIEELILNADTIVAERSYDKFETAIGAAQKDTAVEIGAKLKRAWPIMAVGCALILGAAALFYFGWYTKGAIAIGCAVLCFVLYYVIPLHAGAIALGCLGLFAGLALLVLYVHYFTKGDANRNFVPDVLEGKK